MCLWHIYICLFVSSLSSPLLPSTLCEKVNGSNKFSSKNVPKNYTRKKYKEGKGLEFVKNEHEERHHHSQSIQLR